ncbi:NUDIX domain-containing protein [Candidatus Nanohalovita haloferacivicina]|uniref:NUDIX domain-containing protein n=1 Tax=Candidatus Nanohalovita haloferacivicina TaxID=2978046 RepID=UPI00325FCA3F|nr:NUDIX family hydrolase [Candidatus Nanohalobia archaeon BNXNv]
MVSWFLWKGENLGARIISKFLWPPASAAALVIKDDKVLAVNAGEYLMLPGGLLEREESFEQGAVRETREETGLEVEVRSLVSEKVREGLGVEKIFYAELTGGELSSSWEGRPEWIEISEIEDRDWRYNRDVMRLVEKVQEIKK